jgi:hypothetical protein
MEANIPILHYKGLLEKLESNHQLLRTRTVEGEFMNLPTVGASFRMVGESLTSPGDGCRLVETTKVLTVDIKESTVQKMVIEFTTENSTYRLTIGGSCD